MYHILLIASYISALFLPMAVFLACAFVLALRYRGYALFGVGFIIDVQFSAGLPVYTLTAALIMLIAEFLRPRLMVDTIV